MKVNENEGDSKDLTSTKSWETFVAGSDGGQFNPFNYRKEREIQSVLGISNGNQLSLRKTQMQTLVNELLNVVGDTDETDRVLAEYQDFLLEPLEDLQAVLDPDSIYTGEMNRLERYEAYEQSMSERIRVAKNGKVRQVLECMKDFVLSHRE